MEKGRSYYKKGNDLDVSTHSGKVLRDKGGIRTLSVCS